MRSTSAATSAMWWSHVSPAARCNKRPPAHPLRLNVDHTFQADGAAVHLEFEAKDGRSIQVPSQPGVRRATPDYLIGKEWINVVHGVYLRRSGISPAAIE